MRVLVISDVHANLVALEAVLDATRDAYDAVWCLGDTVGYGPQPDECVGRIRSLATAAVVGNHDWAVLGKMDIDDFNPEARRAVIWTRDNISRSNMDWLAALPSAPIVREGITITHASPRDPIWEYVVYVSVASANLKHFDTRFCLVGHTHVPAVYATEGDGRVHVVPTELNKPLVLGERWRGLLNPGSVGQPRDNDRRAAYALIDTEKCTWEQRRVEYNIETTQARMRAAGLPERLINRLAYGW